MFSQVIPYEKLTFLNDNCFETLHEQSLSIEFFKNVVVGLGFIYTFIPFM